MRVVLQLPVAVSPSALVVVVVPVVLPGSSEVGEAMKETGRSWTSGCGSAPLGVVIRVTCRQEAGGSSERGGAKRARTCSRYLSRSGGGCCGNLAGQ